MKLILFDLDGTLVDTQRIILEAQRRTLERHGLEHPGAAQGLAVVGLSLQKAIAGIAGPGADHAAMAATYSEIFHALRPDPEWTPRLYPGAAGLIDDLSARADVLLGIATGRSRRGIDLLLEQEGWAGRFFTLQSADNNPSKPDPGMVLSACAEAGVDPGEAIMVGDTAFDMEMARAAGAFGIGVAWGYHAPDTLIPAGASVLVRDFPQLIKAIDAL